MNGFDDHNGLGGIPERAAEAAAALEALQEPTQRATAAIEAAFARAGAGLAGSLARAAADGEVSMAELARAVLAAINAVGSARSDGGLGEAVAAALGGGFRGARAEGGPVAAGGAYLVGERGPEVFRPAGAGSIEPLASGATTINVTVQGERGGAALHRSEAQIAQALARAVSLGARRL